MSEGTCDILTNAKVYAVQLYEPEKQKKTSTPQTAEPGKAQVWLSLPDKRGVVLTGIRAPLKPGSSAKSNWNARQGLARVIQGGIEKPDADFDGNASMKWWNVEDMGSPTCQTKAQEIFGRVVEKAEDKMRALKELDPHFIRDDDARLSLKRNMRCIGKWTTIKAAHWYSDTIHKCDRMVIEGEVVSRFEHSLYLQNRQALQTYFSVSTDAPELVEQLSDFLDPPSERETAAESRVKGGVK